jgi:tetratricopeptide (TPR) repeat protein
MYAHACAEVFFRFWLYRGECPAAISEAVAALSAKHPDLHNFVVHELRAVRDKGLAADLVDEESAFEKRAKHPGRADRAAESAAIETFLKERVISFREAHGIIPLVLEKNGQAFPVPFQMTIRRLGGAHCSDIDGDPVAEWNDTLSPVFEALDSREGVKILCKLPETPTTAYVKDNGIALPVALASFNLDQFAEISPLDVLATGVVSKGSVFAAPALGPKVDLARKMGAHLWVQIGPCDHGANTPGRVMAVAEGEPLKLVLNQIRTCLAEGGMARASVRHAREIIARHFHLPPSAAASIQEAIHTIRKNIQILVDENNGFLLPSIADGYILLASLHNHAGDAKSAAKVLEDVESLLEGDKVRLCKLYAQKVVAFTDLGNLIEAENLGTKARELAHQLDILVPGQAEALIETTGSLGGEALLHKAIRTGDLRDADECYGLLSRTLEIAEDLARAGYQSTYVDSDLWRAKSAARFVLWHAFFEPTKITDRVAEVSAAVRAPLEAGKYDVSGEYLKRTHFLGGYRALLGGKPPEPGEFSRWKMPELSLGAPEWVLATALKYRAALKAHFKQADASVDFEEAAKLLQHTQQPVIRIILWSIAVQAKLSGITGTLFERIFENGIADAVDFLSWDPLAEDLVNRLIDNTYTEEDLREFQLGFAY